MKESKQPAFDVTADQLCIVLCIAQSSVLLNTRRDLIQWNVKGGFGSHGFFSQILEVCTLHNFSKIRCGGNKQPASGLYNLCCCYLVDLAYCKLSVENLFKVVSSYKRNIILFECKAVWAGNGYHLKFYISLYNLSRTFFKLAFNYSRHAKIRTVNLI